MKNLIFFFLFSLLLPLSSFSSDHLRHEWEFTPHSIGYSTSGGLMYSFSTTYYHKLWERLQIGLGGNFADTGDGYNLGYQIFLDYNFSNDLEESYFLGVGVLYKNHQVYGDDWDYTSLVIKGGKRFMISEKKQIYYKPFAQIYRTPCCDISVGIYPVNFTWGFD